MGEHIVLVYLVVCFFVFLAGFVDSIAGGGSETARQHEDAEG